MKPTLHLKKFYFCLSILLLPLSSFAIHYPDIGEMSIVQELAHTLEKSTKKLHRTIEMTITNPTSTEAKAIENVHRLEKAARQFHHEVEESMSSPFLTEAYFRELVYVANNVERSFEYLASYERIETLYSEVQRDLTDLNQYFRMWLISDVIEWAHTIDKTTRKIHKYVERELGSGITFHQRESIEALHKLEKSAHHLHEKIEDLNRTSSQTYDEMMELDDAFFDAEFEIDYINVDPMVMDNFRMLVPLIKNLLAVYRYSIFQ